MSNLSDLYQEVILDHNKNPRNQGKLESADRTAEGYNPLCGDKLTVYVEMDGDRIEDIRFDGVGCAISQASASVMTTVVKGRTTAEVEELFRRFQKIVTGEESSPEELEKLGELAAMAGVSQFPTRVKCATLGWHTLLDAVHGKKTTTGPATA